MENFEEEFLKITFEEPVAVMEWLGLAKTDNYRLGHNQFTKMLREHPLRRWLFNYKQGRVIDIKDQNWTTEEWFPEALAVLENDLYKIGVVLSSDIFNKVAVRIITEKIRNEYDIEIAFFEDEDEAMEWLAAEPSEIEAS